MSFTRLRTTCLGALLALVATLLIAPTAQAAPTTPTKPKALQDCGYSVPTGETLCVPRGTDLATAWRAKTGRAVVDAERTQARTDAAPAGVLVDYPMAIVYDDINYGGSSLTFYNWNYCITGGEIYFNYPTSWFGRVSSAQGRSYCQVKLYMFRDKIGVTVGYAANIPWVGSYLNDNTRSVSVTR